MRVQKIGERIKFLREARGLTLRKLGDELGVTPSYLADVESGRRYPTDERIEELASVLDCSVEDDVLMYDTRPKVSDVRRRMLDEPEFALAIRFIMLHNVPGDELIAFLRSRPNR